MLVKSFNWKITAQAGDGVMLSSGLFAKLAKRHGYHAYNYYEYPSLIRGGVQSGQVYVSLESTPCQRRDLDLLILFHENILDSMVDQLHQGSVVILNASKYDASKHPKIKATVVPIDMTRISKESTGATLSTNVVAVAISTLLFSMDIEMFKEIIREEFAAKPKVADLNIKAIDQGVAEAQALITEKKLPIIAKLPKRKDKQIVVTGNEAIGLGAIAAGIQFYSAYPMTPASAVLHYLASQQANYNIVVKHCEDEISAINQALGASFAGVRSATGSAGGGFALMVEALSFSGGAEIPLVVVEACRQAPATGLPTWTSQGDLNFVVDAGHGDFLKVVLTPNSVEEHYELAKKAFYLAEKYQLPVLILSDKQMLESSQTMPTPDEEVSNQRYTMVADGKLGAVGLTADFARYADDKKGLSLRSIPGQKNGWQLTNSYEHDPQGFATEDPAVVKPSVDKRARKLKELLKEVPAPIYYGDEKPKKIFIAFGSSVGVMQEVLKDKLKEKIGLISLPCVWPMPVEKLEKLLAGKKAEIWTVEGNATGQLAQLLRRSTELKDIHSVLRYDGQPLYAEDLTPWINGQSLSKQYQIK